MKLGIDVTSLLYDRGVSRYTANLVRALLTQPNMQVTAYGSTLRQQARLRQKIERLGPVHRTVIQPYGPTFQNVMWNWLKVNPIRKSLPGIDVFHSWDWLQPPDHNLPTVSTIHDLAILKYPETAHPKILAMHQQAWQKLRKNRAQIIAVSRSTKKDIVELLEIPPERVHVIYEALPREMRAVAERLTEEKALEIQTRLQLPEKYLLFVGTREPRKNIFRLIEAWLPLAETIHLLIVGEQGWDETSSPAIKKALSHPHLHFMGQVSDAELTVMYSEAEALAYPCLYEGFGLPILEAFYHGIPVITSSVSSMVEVAGNAAELVNPLSVESIRQGIEVILNESTTEQQKRMQRMVIRLQMFDWQRVANQTVSVYQRAMQEYS
jgi:glycosyltransferase involved in cell wall biosynthesis